MEKMLPGLPQGVTSVDSKLEIEEPAYALDY